MPNRTTRCAPGVCIPWEDKKKELPKITGDENLLRSVWENVDLFGYTHDDFIPEVKDWIGAASFLPVAQESDVCLFI